MRRAFTLIELLVVIAIIMVLAALILGSANMVRKTMREQATSQRVQEVLRSAQSIGANESSAALKLQSSLGSLTAPRRIRHIGELRPNKSTGYLDKVSGTWVEAPMASWEFVHPWGKPAAVYPPADPSEGRLPAASVTMAPDDHALADLTAAFTLELLQLAGGILPMDDPATTGVNEAIEAYTNDRNPERPWNDAYGNPIVIGLASYFPRRNTATVIKETVKYGGGGGNKTRDMIRDDLYIRTNQKAYGYTRSIYLAAGALGPKRDSAISLDPSADWTSLGTGQLDLLWARITGVAGVDEGGTQLWRTDATAGVNAFADPPWQGVRKGKRDGYTCFVSAPTELR
ncbi:MAG: type II secretion system protein [Planctomycetota bacterium]|jgi:prepilin-type N-terminal cleavage/methylation domain-containing protein|nr:type II secretion system protein [Planctomycetota bacterium]